MDNLSKYLEDKRFIQWVFNPDTNLDRWWESYYNSNPDEKQKIQLAKSILQKLRTHDRKLTESEKILLSSRILKRMENHDQTQKIRKFITGLIKYAAVAILFFSFGALLFYQKNNVNSFWTAFDITEPVFQDEPVLVRPDGENIFLSEKSSRVEHRNDGQVVVNNQVIDEHSSAKKGMPEINQLIIPWGRTSEIILPDGTRVWLNAGSRLIYPEFFVGKTRELFLVGEAYFEVEHDEKPFVVQTTDMRLKVLGTRFNVSAYPADNNIETVLVEGKLKLDQINKGLFSETIYIDPGQLAAFNKAEQSTQFSEVNTDHYTLWTKGLLRFQSADLSRLIKRLERYYNVRFKYDDPFLGAIKISGKLELNDSHEEVLENVARVGSVKITNIGKNYYEISRK